MSRQKFKGKTYTTKGTVDNILQIYNQSTDFTDWYTNAHLFACSLCKYMPTESLSSALRKACGIIAALSPLKSWQENKLIAESFLRNGNGRHTKAFKQKAKDILNSDGEVDTIATILNGNKITSFFLNILNPETSQAVTIDRHAISIAVGQSLTGDDLKTTNNQYQFFSNCYRIAGEKVGVPALQMQAITWVKWRELKQEKDFADVPF